MMIVLLFLLACSFSLFFHQSFLVPADSHHFHHFPIASLYCTRKLMNASIMVICANVCVCQHWKRGNWERNRLKSVCLIGFIISREQRAESSSSSVAKPIAKAAAGVHDHHHHHHWWWCAGGGNWWWTTSVLPLPVTLLSSPSSPPDLHFALLPFSCTDYYFDCRCHIH